jgi:nicotinate-nucleotide pyrophosphorylase (carboxylating)
MTLSEIIKYTLIEDVQQGDFSSLSTIPAQAQSKAKCIIKESGILAGMEVAREVFHQVDPNLQFETLLNDGSRVNPGDMAFKVSGAAISILTAERTALNFMQRMSGIATKTAQYVAQLQGTQTRLLDTRKTTPLLRQLEKQAVKIGGGYNHRFGLYDMIMIKDNHIDFAGGIANAIDSCQRYLKQNHLQLKIEIEVRNFQELDQVLQVGGIHRIMLDNFKPEDLRKAVEIIGGKFETEASGGIVLETINTYARTGVDYISVGALTHHIKSLDISLVAD